MAGRLTVVLVVVLGIGASVSGAPPAGGLAWHEKYKRPSEIPYPKDNPYSDAKFKLGRTLFFDPILSGSKSRSCETCHNPGLSWGDGQPRAIGENQKPLPVRAPTLLNVAWTPKLGWDGHFRDLEAVGIAAITSPGNMNLSDKALPERLSAIPGYLDAFDAAFGEGDVTVHKVEMALATFERSIVSRKRRSTVGSMATTLRSTQPPSAALHCSTAKRIARPVTAVGLSPTRRFTISGPPTMRTSAAADCFRAPRR